MNVEGLLIQKRCIHVGFAAVFLGDGLHVTPGSKKNAVCTVRLFFFFFFEFSQFYYIEKCNFSARSGVLESLAHFLFWHHEEVLEAA